MALQNVMRVDGGNIIGPSDPSLIRAENVSYGQGTVEDALDDLTDWLNDVNDALDSIGDNVFVYPENTSVPSAIMTTIATVSITKPGIYMLYGGCSFTSSFSDLTILKLYANTTAIKGTNIRATGLAGGGMNTCAIYKKTNSTPININMRVYQGASSTATASDIALGAVLIKEL